MNNFEISTLKKALKAGKIVCFPTDTLYALSCDATNDEAIEKIYSLKRRAKHKALPIFVKSLNAALNYAIFNDHATALAKAFWPGPLTLVLRAKENTNLSKNIHLDNENIAIRVPNHKNVNLLLQSLDFPIIATSANVSDMDNQFAIEDIKAEFGDAVEIYVNDELNSISKLASSIVDCTEIAPKLIRIGAIGAQDIEKLGK